MVTAFADTLYWSEAFGLMRSNLDGTDIEMIQRTRGAYHSPSIAEHPALSRKRVHRWVTQMWINDVSRTRADGPVARTSL